MKHNKFHFLAVFALLHIGGASTCGAQDISNTDSARENLLYIAKQFLGEGTFNILEFAQNRPDRDNFLNALMLWNVRIDDTSVSQCAFDIVSKPDPTTFKKKWDNTADLDNSIALAKYHIDFTKIKNNAVKLIDDAKLGPLSGTRVILGTIVNAGDEFNAVDPISCTVTLANGKVAPWQSSPCASTPFRFFNKSAPASSVSIFFKSKTRDEVIPIIKGLLQACAR